MSDIRKVIKVVKSVCYECGVSANVVTCLKKYGAPPKKLSFTTSTYHEGICDVCKEKKQVTEPRDFFYPDFELLKDMPFIFEDAWKYNDLM